MNVLIELIENVKNEELYQWDKDRQIRFSTLLNENIDEVHFSNEYLSETLIVIPTKTVDGYYIANIPNILLQYASPIDVYFESCECTACKNRFTVNPRKKPSDYVYTETELKTYEVLEKSISQSVQIVEQDFTEDQRTQARKNIGAASADLNVFKLLSECNVIEPVVDSNGKFFTDENGKVFVL